MKIGVVSLGCAKNLIDTQKALSFLKASGHQFVADPALADAIIVNTCGFILDAKVEAINTILEMAEHKQSGCQYLIVMGCMVQRYREELEKEIPEVDLWISLDEYGHLEDIFNDFFHTETICAPEILLATAPYTAYLRIADGCSHRCAFCAIPLIRGNYRSEKMEDLLAEAEKLKQLGVRELNLIAQDTTFYGRELYGRFMLHELLKQLDAMDFHWIRILYMYPDEIYDELLETIANSKHIVPYFDIPSQHGADGVLRRMYRRGSKDLFRKNVGRIREMFKDPVLRTTVITGFPGETDEDFRELMEFTREMQWDRLGCFAYSLEENTPAYAMPDRVPQETAMARRDELMTLQQQISRNIAQKYVGRRLEVLVERGRTIVDPYYRGRGYMNAPDDVDGAIFFKASRTLEPGEFVEVEITEARDYDLYGKLAREEE